LPLEIFPENSITRSAKIARRFERGSEKQIETDKDMMLGFIIMDYWWVAIPGLLLGMYAQMKLMSAYGRYSQVANAAGMTGAQAAREVLDSAGLYNMPIEEVGGHLTDHYDPTKKTLFLSSENYQGTSIAAVGVAAHEAGHALQHKAAYAPLHIRMALVPVTQFASIAWGILFLIGILFHMFAQFLGIAIILFSIMALFQLITLRWNSTRVAGPKNNFSAWA
jgi:hypothetical protein